MLAQQEQSLSGVMSQSVDYPVGLLKQLNKGYIIHIYDTKVRKLCILNFNQ